VALYGLPAIRRELGLMLPRRRQHDRPGRQTAPTDRPQLASHNQLPAGGADEHLLLAGAAHATGETGRYPAARGDVGHTDGEQQGGLEGRRRGHGACSRRVISSIASRSATACVSLPSNSMIAARSSNRSACSGVSAETAGWEFSRAIASAFRLRISRPSDSTVLGPMNASIPPGRGSSRPSSRSRSLNSSAIGFMWLTQTFRIPCADLPQTLAGRGLAASVSQVVTWLQDRRPCRPWAGLETFARRRARLHIALT